jgi:hypothetical protein
MTAPSSQIPPTFPGASDVATAPGRAAQRLGAAWARTRGFRGLWLAVLLLPLAGFGAAAWLSWRAVEAETRAPPQEAVLIAAGPDRRRRLYARHELGRDRHLDRAARLPRTAGREHAFQCRRRAGQARRAARREQPAAGPSAPGGAGGAGLRTGPSGRGGPGHRPSGRHAAGHLRGRGGDRPRHRRARLHPQPAALRRGRRG